MTREKTRFAAFAAGRRSYATTRPVLILGRPTARHALPQDPGTTTPGTEPERANVPRRAAPIVNLTAVARPGPRQSYVGLVTAAKSVWPLAAGSLWIGDCAAASDGRRSGLTRWSGDAMTAGRGVTCSLVRCGRAKGDACRARVGRRQVRGPATWAIGCAVACPTLQRGRPGTEQAATSWRTVRAWACTMDMRTCGQAAASAPSRAPSHQFSASVRCAQSARKRGPSPHPKRSNEGRVEQQRGEQLESARVWPASICHAEMRLRACATPASRPPAASRSTYPGVLERVPGLALAACGHSVKV